MIGTCSSCGSYGEIDAVLVPNGATRLICSICCGRGTPTGMVPARFKLLVARLRNGSLTDGETVVLRNVLLRMEHRLEAAPDPVRLERVHELLQEVG